MGEDQVHKPVELGGRGPLVKLLHQERRDRVVDAAHHPFERRHVAVLLDDIQQPVREAVKLAALRRVSASSPACTPFATNREDLVEVAVVANLAEKEVARDARFDGSHLSQC